MKREFKFLRSCMAMLLAVCMVLGCSNGLVAYAAEALSEETLNYVSLGDSMTNGYCFTGYNQGVSTEDSGYNFIKGVGVYGTDAYPLQFEEYLEEQGYDVNHIKLAASATLAGDLWYLLGGREEPDDNWVGFLDYTGRSNREKIDGKWYAKEALIKHFQDAVTDADVMTVCLGNAEFGAYLLQRITDALGVLGSSLSDNSKVTLQDALDYSGLDAEQQALVQEVYDMLIAELKSYIPNDLWKQYNVQEICNLLAYTTAGYIFNYKGVLETIVEMNPDVEIVLVGMMNTTYGMTVTMDDGRYIPVGDIMDGVFGLLNAYVAGLPAAMQLCGEWEDATFYYAEQPAPKFISQQFAALKEAKWGKIDDGRLDGAIVRDRNIVAYNGRLCSMIGSAFNMTLPNITIDQVEQFETCGAVLDGNTTNNDASVSCAVYLAIEDATAASTDTLDIPLSALEKIADLDALKGVFNDVELDTTSYVNIRTSLAKYLISTDELMGMMKIYALFQVGNGMSVHPTPSGHDEIAQAVIKAYETGYTAADKTLDNLTWAANTLYDLVLEYYDEAYAYAYAYAKDAGYIDTVAQGITEAQAYLNALAAQLAELDMTQEFAAQLNEQLASINATLTAAYNLISTADMLDQETYDAAVALLKQAEKAVEDLVELAKQAGEDVVELVVIPALEEAYAKLLNEVLPAAEEAAQEIYEAAYDYLYNKVGPELQEALDALVDALEEKAQEVYPEIADMIYDYLYENPEKVIAFISEYGDDAVEFLSQYVDEAMAVVAYIVSNYGWDIAEAVLDNADTILTAMVDWVNTHGENAWALIRVYLDELGIMDYLPTEAEINEAIAMVEAIIADCRSQLEGATDQMLEQLEALLPVLEQQLDELKELVEGYAQLLDEQVQAQLEAALAELEAALAQLEQAADELKSAVEAQLEELIPQLEAAYEAALEDFEAALEDLKDNIEGAVATVRDAIENLYDILDDYRDAAADLAAGAVDLLNEALEQLEAILAEHADEINAQVLPELMEAVDEIAQMLEELDQLIRSSADATAEEFTAQLKALLAQLEAQVEELVAIAQGQVDEIVSEAIAAFELAYKNATTDEYSITKDSYYVAIGDGTLAGNNSYADKLAKELDIDYSKIYTDDLTPAGALALLKASDEAQAQIAIADLVTLGFSNNTLVDFMFDNVNRFSLSGNINLDWSIFGIDGLDEQIAVALEELEAALEEKLQSAEYSAMLRVAVESYVYAYTSHMMTYPMLAEAIHKINDDALVIMIGMNNAFEDVVLTYEGEEIELGDYVQYLVDAANIEALVYAMLTGNAIYVETPDVETILDDNGYNLSGDLLTRFVNLLSSNTRDMLDPSDAGHEYIKNQILGALDVDYGFLLGDVNLDGSVSSADVAMLFDYIMESESVNLSALQLLAADVNEDGNVSSADVAMLFDYIMEEITSLGAQPVTP